MRNKLLYTFLKLTMVKSASELNPKPWTPPVFESAHCPNFCEVFLNVIFSVNVLLIIT